MKNKHRTGVGWVKLSYGDVVPVSCEYLILRPPPWRTVRADKVVRGAEISHSLRSDSQYKKTNKIMRRNKRRFLRFCVHTGWIRLSYRAKEKSKIAHKLRYHAHELMRILYGVTNIFIWLFF